MRVIVAGMVASYPVGGVAWDYLQYVIGLARLGHDVYYHEDTWSWPYEPIKKCHTDDASYSAQYLAEYFMRYAPELSHRWHYRHLHETSYGMSQEQFAEIARTADLFVNISGASLFPDELSPDCVKIFLDTDPGYNQIVLSEKFDWSENVQRWCENVAAHDQHFTYAENMYDEECAVPRLGFEWKPTRMPIVTDLWKSITAKAAPLGAPWTTVMTWNAFKGPLLYKGVEYKSKGGEFERFINLPRQVEIPFMVAVGGINAPLQRLVEHGWNVIDGPTATLTAEQYQSFIKDSRGELSTAKHVYVALKTGWFSCRTACYLAAGRPAVVQDTGFSKIIPCGEGLFSFDTMDEAAGALEQVEADYTHHSQAARELATEYFEASKVLSRFINDATASKLGVDEHRA